jgi:uncharacterized circularly permuted ATP-grasp superfamily protein
VAHENQQFRRAFEDEDAPVTIYRPELNQYPRIVQHEKHGKKLVESKEEHDALNEKHGIEFVSPGHEAPAEPKPERAPAELSQEDDQRISELEDRVTQLEAMLADMISKKKPGKDKPADNS